MNEDDSSSVDGKIMHVENLLLHEPEYRSTMRLLLVSKTDLLRVDNGFVQRFGQFQEAAMIRRLTFNREKILDVYIKLEVILAELIKMYLVGFELKKSVMLEEILKNTQMHRKREILKAWGVLDKALSTQLEVHSRVRNAVAHSWILRGIKYKEYYLKDNLEDFKLDLESSWTKVIEVYMKEQTKHIDSLIERLEKDLAHE